MKHIITALLLALAVAAGLLLPEVFMEWQDQKLETPQLVSVTEPVLEWNTAKASAAAEITNDVLIHRLELFGTQSPVTVPIGTATTEDIDRVINLSNAFLEQAIEADLDIDYHGSDLQLAWFEDNTAVPFWTVYAEFNGSWICILTIDDDTGAVLQCALNGNGAYLAELYPACFEEASSEPDTHFEDLAAAQFCKALGLFWGGSNGEEAAVVYDAASGTVSVSFPAGSELSAPLLFTVDPAEGIWFNRP